MATNFKHGEGHNNNNKTSEYRTWTGMKERCYNPNRVGFHRYGGRGIKVCDRWRDNYIQFLTDMGRRLYKEASLDRIDNDGDYSPENCRWTDLKTQMRNRENSVYLMVGNKSVAAVELAERMGVDRTVIYHYLKVKDYIDGHVN